MRFCFPVERDEGLDSRVFGHFGSAPAFLIIDSETKEEKTITNKDMHHEHGMCNPVNALSGEQVDAVVAGGIGGGALAGLNSAGIVVYKAFYGTVRENLTAFGTRGLSLFTPDRTCAGHGGCAH